LECRAGTWSEKSSSGSGIHPDFRQVRLYSHGRRGSEYVLAKRKSKRQHTFLGDRRGRCRLAPRPRNQKDALRASRKTIKAASFLGRLFSMHKSHALTSTRVNQAWRRHGARGAQLDNGSVSSTLARDEPPKRGRALSRLIDLPIEEHELRDRRGRALFKRSDGMTGS